VAKVDRRIAIFHRGLDWITQIALRDDLDFWVVGGKVDYRFPHPASRADEQHAHGRLLH
jgi:hypothetical protein